MFTMYITESDDGPHLWYAIIASRPTFIYLFAKL